MTETCENCEAIVTSKVSKYSKERYGHVWCYSCQRNDSSVGDQITKIQTEKIKPKETKKSNWQEDIVDFESLLNKAHELYKNNFSIKTKCLLLDSEHKLAYFKAVVEIKKDNNIQQFFGHGDASFENLTEMIAPHFYRMAETRAVVRALRFATNCAKTAEEEKA